MLERAVIMTDKRNAMLGKQAFTEVDAAVESDAKTLPELVSAYDWELFKVSYPAKHAQSGLR